MAQGRKHGFATAVFAALMFTSACDNDTGAQPLPPGESSTTAPTSASPSHTRPAWESQYTPRQLRAYEAALRRYQEYETRSEPIWRAGEATPRTARFFKKYFLGWFNQQRLLSTYDKNDVRLVGLGRTLDSQPTRIVASGGDGQSVTIKQCVDFNTMQTIQHGKETRKFTKEPQVRTITLSRFNRPEEPWIITDLETSLGKRSCSTA